MTELNQSCFSILAVLVLLSLKLSIFSNSESYFGFLFFFCGQPLGMLSEFSCARHDKNYVKGEPHCYAIQK